MQKFKFLFIDCSKAANYCDKSQYKEARTMEKIKMFLHLVFCDNCRDYTSKNTKLSKLIRKSGLKSCSKEEKRNWEAKIQKELAKEKR